MSLRRPAAAGIMAAAAAAAAVTGLVTGCAGFDKAFGKQEAVVQFRPQTPAAQMLRVRASCSHVPAATPEAIPRHLVAVQLPDNIRYLVSNASDADLARLQQCLERFRSVVGVEFITPSGS